MRVNYFKFFDDFSSLQRKQMASSYGPMVCFRLFIGAGERKKAARIPQAKSTSRRVSQST